MFKQDPEFIVLTLRLPITGKPRTVSGSGFSFRTPIEQRLYYSLMFQKSYVRSRHQYQIEMVEEPGWLAGKIGAERIIEHDYPGSRYRLAVFRNRGTLTVEKPELIP